MKNKGIFRQRLIQSVEEQEITSWKPLFGILIGFVMIRLLLEGLFPLAQRQQRVEWVGPTQQSFSIFEENIDILLLGSSRIYRGLNPEVIQQSASKQGTALTVFNHAWPNMTLLEIQSIIQDASLENVDVLLFEPSMHSQWVVNNPNSLRAHTFFTPQNTLHHIQYLSCAGFPLKLSLSSAYHATMAMLSPILGRGLLQQYLTIDEHPPSAPPQGYIPLDQESKDSFLQRKKTFQKQRKQYNKKRERLFKKASTPPSACQIEELEKTIQLIQSKGVQPVLLFPPTVRMAKEYNGLAQAAANLDVPSLVYDIERVPELYEPQLRYDEEHLNAAGAAVWSRILIDDLLQLQAQ